MSTNPGQDPDGDDSGGQNPFKGTPFEQLFGGGGGTPDLGALFSQIQSLMQPHDGAINWEFATDLARKVVAQSPDPTPTQRQKDAVADAVRLADHWLDDATSFPSGVTAATAWSRAEWIVGTTDVWKVLVEPVAERSVNAMGGALPEEAKAMAGPLMGILGKAVGAMLASQIGSGVGALAGEVLTASDIGLPLGPAGRAALLPSNITEFAKGLDVGEDDVLLYLALREAAHQRLFGHVPWLREHLIGAVTDYARGLEINTENIQNRVEEQMRGIDPTNPESLQELLEGGLFDIPKSPAQEAALQRLEVTLAAHRGVGRRGRRPGHRRADARGRQAPGGRTPSARGRRSGRADLRLARGARAPAAAASRRVDAVGFPARPPGHRGPRRRVDAPRPAAHGRRPRRPARLPRGRLGARRDDRRGLRRGAEEPARGRRSLG